MLGARTTIAFSYRLASVLGMLMLSCPYAIAQESQENHVTVRHNSERSAGQLAAAVPKANVADVSSPEAIIKALHASVSGPAQPRFNWDRFRSLLLPNAHVGGIGSTNGPVHVTYQSVDEFLAENGAERNNVAWYENLIAMRVVKYGNIASVFYTHDDRKAPDAKPIYQSANLAQLVFDGTRWWIASVIWNITPEPGSLPDDMKTPDKAK